MQFGRFGGALVLALIALSDGCTTAPATTGRPSASAVPVTSPSPIASPPAKASEPAGSSIPGPTPAPVVLLAAGATRLVAISGGAVRFVALDGGRAQCQSVPDGLAVEGVTALELGKLGSGTLRGMLGLPGSSSAAASIELLVDSGEFVEGSFQPFWRGPVKVTESHDQGASGTVTFSGLRLEADAGSKPGLSPLPGVGHWPATLTGRMSWSCEPWAIPASSAPPSIAP